MAETIGLLNHLLDIDLYNAEKPYEIWLEKVGPGVPRTNVKFETVNVPLTDIRDLPETRRPTLGTHGFEIFECPFPVDCNINGADDVGPLPAQREAMQRYIQSCTTALLEHFAGRKAICYDWRVRKARNKPLNLTPLIYSLTLAEDEDARESNIDVAHQVHGDSSPDGSKKMLVYLLSQDEKLALASGEGRLRMVNLWRPIIPIVENEPLAYCDVRTVEENDWEPVEKIQEDWIEESMYLKHRKYHKWYWCSRQTRDEALVFTIWDSDTPNRRSASTAHGSVPLSHGPMARPRESIEMRFLLWTD